MSGKVALLTNADQGVGFATAMALAHSGAELALTLGAAHDPQFVEELRLSGCRISVYPASPVLDNIEATQLVRSVIAEHGYLDIAIINEKRRFQWQVDDLDLDEDALDEQYRVNVRGAIALIRAAVRVMRSDGRVVALGSCIADRVGTPGLAHFAATGAAISAFCKGAAHDLGPRAITVNVVQIGAIESDFLTSAADFAAAEREANALKRLGTAHEIAAAILFLASPGASFITGTTINVDGGYNA